MLTCAHVSSGIVLCCLSFTKCFLSGDGSICTAGMEMTEKRKRSYLYEEDGETLHGKGWGGGLQGILLPIPYKEMEAERCRRSLETAVAKRHMGLIDTHGGGTYARVPSGFYEA